MANARITKSLCEKPRSSRCQAVQHQVDHRESDHRLAALGQHFIVFAVTAIAAQPGERPLHDPSFGQNLEAGQVVTSLDYFQRPAAESTGPIYQLPGVTAVGPDQSQTAKHAAEFLQNQLGTVAVLNGGGVNHHAQDQPQRVYNHMPLAAVDFLARVVPMRPPFSVVFTDCESMTAAEGVGFLPAATLTFSRRAS